MAGNILVAIDLEHRDCAIKALKEGAELARQKEAALHVCFVLAYGFHTYVQPYLMEEVIKDTIKHVKEDLKYLVKEAGLDGDKVIQHVLKGGVHQQILLLAEKLACDYLVLNASRPDASAGVTGPVTAQICRYAPCSLLIIR
nr:universal stress protein [uncultured Cohaesibacter sp.]